MTDQKKNQWRLKSVKASNFRGIKDDLHLSFDQLPVLIHGKNGVGKSSIAQLIQWTLYGKFPGNVLKNAMFESFLSPVTARKKKAYSGELEFAGGDETLNIYRDADNKNFSITHNGISIKGDTASEKLKDLFQLDMETFHRAILLQQSKIRSILTDEIKERNKAMDRLLGMDTIGDLLENLKTNRFVKEADKLREGVRSTENKFSAQEELLQEQREKTEKKARELEFKNSDFYPEGLGAAYSILNADLKSLGEKYNVEVEDLPDCTTAEIAEEADSILRQSIKTIRQRSELNKLLAPVVASIADLTSLRVAWLNCIENRDQSGEKLKRFTKENGELETIQQPQNEQKAKRLTIQNELKATNALRQLLVEARHFIEAEKSTQCPVCLQNFPEASDIPVDLADRIEKLASVTIEEKEKSITAIEATLENTNLIIESLNQLSKNYTKAQEELSVCHQKVTEMLEGKDLAESKAIVELDNQLSQLTHQQAQLKDGINSLEKDIEAVEVKGDRIYSGLLPVLQQRAKQEELEKQWKEAKEQHKNETAEAEKMDGYVSQIESIRNALMESKDELASRWLKKAKPRSSELYRSLVQHPLFDTMEIIPKKTKVKVDYNFNVSIEGETGSSREARLVLSDGQLTAAAMALLFSLAESTAHGLDILYIDDPTQNLDDLHKRAMSQVICEIAKQKQVIVSTQDDDFVASLNSNGFRDMAIVHHITKWDGKPVIESNNPYD